MCKSVRALKVVLLLCATLALAVTLFVNYVSASGLMLGRQIGLLFDWNTTLSWSQRGTFQNSTITPSSWAFSVWIVIYAWQILWLAFCWSTICRRAYDDGPFLCNEPDLAPNGLLVWHFLSSLCNMAWILLADSVDFNRSLLIPQTCVLMGAAVCLYAALGSSYYCLQRDKDLLVNCGRRVDYWATVILVQNGLSLYAGWGTCASFINLDLALLFNSSLSTLTTSFVSLSLLIAIGTTYVICDLTVLDPYVRFVFTPHLVVGWAIGASMAKNFSAWTPNTILSVLLACLVGAGLLLKIVGIIVRSRTSPIFTGNTYQLKRV